MIVTILGYVQSPTKNHRIEDHGFALEDRLAKKRQFDEFTKRDGSPRRV